MEFDRQPTPDQEALVEQLMSLLKGKRGQDDTTKQSEQVLHFVRREDPEDK